MRVWWKVGTAGHGYWVNRNLLNMLSLFMMISHCYCGIFQEKGLALVSPRDTKAPRVLVPLKNCPEGKFVYSSSVSLSMCRQKVCYIFNHTFLTA